MSLNVGPDLFGGAEFEALREAEERWSFHGRKYSYDPDSLAKNAGATQYVVRRKSPGDASCAPYWPWAISLHQFSKTYLPYIELWGAAQEDVETLKRKVVRGMNDSDPNQHMRAADFYQLSPATQTALVENLSLRARLRNYRSWFTQLFAAHLELCARRICFPPSGMNGTKSQRRNSHLLVAGSRTRIVGRKYLA